ncbi:MAG: hypothetical protein HGA20_15030 [Geobacteraceae bacterium]|nr:hypothetical protein [Geobacteraceae bacterium]
MSNMRQTILDAVITRLKTITLANNYNLAIGQKVYDWRLTPIRPEDLPAIEVRDGEAPIEMTTMDGGLSHRLQLKVVILASGLTAAATIRKGLEDISRAISTDPWFGGLVKSFMPESTGIELQQEENLLAAGQYSFTLVYYTDAGQI